jgi:2-polyprenyl-3-methyl-5-hydroxy-6-metoxy-1,4-benzoquinol methylase
MLSGEATCNLCGQKSFKVIEEDEPPFRVVQCKNCTLVFVHPLPSMTVLEEHYDDTYYRDWLAAQRESRIKMWNNRLNRLNRFRSGGHLLDVGCAEGAFLQLAKDSGWQTSGTEVSTYAAKYAADVSGADIFCGELPDAGYPDNSFDVVTMWHVLEHTRDPMGYLREIYHILKADGLLVIAIPNRNDLIMRIAYRILRRRKMKLFSRGERELHLYFFSPKTIMAYLDETRFDCLRLSPDFGIVESSKRFINAVSLIPYYLTRLKIFNAIEIYAAPKHE